MKSIITDNTKNSFYSKTLLPNENGCMEWVGLKTLNGYGILSVNSKNFSAHRFAYMLYKGEIPENMNVLHHCDNRKCVAPDHLFLGTQKDNMVDMVLKNRAYMKKGGNHPNAKYSKNDILNIKKLLFAGYTQAKIAEIYNTSQASISSILRKRNWKHIKFTDDEIKLINDLSERVKKRSIAESKRKLNDDQVKEIRDLLKEGKTCTEIAPLYNVHRSVINNIKLGKHYKEPLKNL